MSKCYGCGAEIQFNDISLPGYVPESVFSETDKVLCQRCYKLKHYGQLLPVSADSDFSKNIDTVLRDFKNIIYVIDIIDFNGTFRDEICEKIKNKNVILVVNKVDLLPKAVSYNDLKNWVYNQVKDKLPIKREFIRMVSAKNSTGIKRLFRVIKENFNSKMLVMGVTNVGKSSVMNALDYSHNSTVSSYPGTTLKLIKSNIKNLDHEVFDSPGIEPKDRLSDLLDIYAQVKMIPVKEISRKTFKPDPGRVLFISALFRMKILDYVKDDLNPVFIIFAPQNISFHETNEERAEEILGNRKVLFPPFDDNFNFEAIETERKNYTIYEGSDLVIPGLGWISVRRGPLKTTLWYPKGIKPIIRKSMVSPK